MASASTVNELFVNKLASGGSQKTAQFAEGVIRDRLREVSFIRKIMDPIFVTRADCQVSEKHDTLVKVVSIEPQSRAMALTFRGQPKARFIRGERAFVSFFTISSEKFQKTEQELLAYEYPITKVIEENTPKDIQEVEDREGLLHAEAAVQALQKEANGGVVKALNGTTLQSGTPPVEFSVRKGELARASTTDDATVRPVQRKDLVEGHKMIDRRRLRSMTTLLTDVDFDDVLSWTVEDNGDRIQSETTVDGYKYNTLLGRAYIRTVKTDILRPGNIYFFTDQNFLGRFFVLNQTKFYIDKVANLITFQAWEDVGMIYMNVAGISKMELYAADASSLDANSLRSNFLPVTEDQLGAVNNRVADGLTFPRVSAV